ncbi:uncharacterized protein LOC122198147 [Lactuca sativa]|uniref:uncharacterized protein LOC122198147 n=1 Tax=Lactuca sativa TaxID=4236 RepID=UPI001C68801C|nr:uncharacterized protein LOC122198147 [Lactuca sativa]
MVKDMGFGAFIGMVLYSLPGKLCYYLVDNFVSSTCAIRLINGEVKITKDTLHSMFGLPNGGLDFKIMPSCVKTYPLLVAWKDQFEDGKYNITNYLKKIQGTHKGDEFFKLNFLALFINTMLESELMGSCKVDFIDKLVLCKDISNINWCDWFIETLVKSKNKWRANDKNCHYIGPISLLVVAYADRVICDELILERKRPFIKEIDSKHLRTLEDHEEKKGNFETLDIKEELHGVYIEDKMYEDSKCASKPTIVESVEDTCGIIEMRYRRIIDDKKIMDETIKTGLEIGPDNHEMLQWVSKVCELFCGTVQGTTAAKDVNADEVVNQNVIGNNDDAISPTREGRVMIQSPTIQRSTRSSKKSMNFTNTNKETNERGCVGVVFYGGNSSFDSPINLTPGWIRQADEIEISSAKQKKMDFVNDGPSFGLEITQVTDELQACRVNDVNNEKGNGVFVEVTSSVAEGAKLADDGMNEDDMKELTEVHIG